MRPFFRHVLDPEVVSFILILEQSLNGLQFGLMLFLLAAGLTLVPAMEVTAFLHFGTPRAEQLHVLAYFPPRVLEGGALGRTGLGDRAVRVARRWRGFVLDWLAALPIEERWYLDPGATLHQLDGTAFPALQTFLDLIHARNARTYDAFIRHHVRFWNDDVIGDIDNVCQHIVIVAGLAGAGMTATEPVSEPAREVVP